MGCGLYARHFSPAEIARWVSNAWKQVSSAVIQKSFRKCRITNSLDGSEDDILFEDETANSSSEDDLSSDFDTLETDSNNDL